MLAIPVLLPVVLSALAAFLPIRKQRIREWITEGIVLLNSAITLMLIIHGAGEVRLFSLTVNLPIIFRLDGIGRIFAMIVSVLWPLATLYAFEYMDHAEHKRSFFTFYTITCGITTGIALAGNLITLYFFYELLTLVTLPLVAHELNHASMAAARKYLYYSLGGAACAFIGMMFVLTSAGTTNFTPGGLRFGAGDEGMALVAFLFCFFGFGVKASVFPLHSWLPTASVAPTPVTALLHAVAVVKSGVFAIVRSAYFIFGAKLLQGTYAQYVALAVAAFTILFGSATALREKHIKRRLAYSTVSNLSYILLGAMLFTETGLAAGLLHMLFHSLMKIALFFAAGAVIVKSGREYVNEMRGSGRAMPATMAVFAVAALSLVGIPPLVGFSSKWYLAQAGILAGWWPAALVLIVSAVLTALYVLPISIAAFLPGDIDKCEAGWKMLLPMCLIALLVALIGLHPQPVIRMIADAVKGVV